MILRFEDERTLIAGQRISEMSVVFCKHCAISLVSTLTELSLVSKLGQQLYHKYLTTNSLTLIGLKLYVYELLQQQQNQFAGCRIYESLGY